jgi:hypothetical protein
MPLDSMSDRAIDCDDLDQMHELLLASDVVEGPPELKEIVRQLWPELLHKVKPPLKEMH